GALGKRRAQRPGDRDDRGLVVILVNASASSAAAVQRHHLRVHLPFRQQKRVRLFSLAANGQRPDEPPGDRPVFRHFHAKKELLSGGGKKRRLPLVGTAR